MTRPVLRLATRMSRRTRWTAGAIALACMVLVGSLSLVAGLGAGVGSVTARFSSGTTVYLHGTDLLASAIDENAVAAAVADFQVLRVHMGALSVNGLEMTVTVASLSDYKRGNVSVPFPSGSRDVALDSGLRTLIESQSGSPPGTNASLSLFGLPLQNVTVAAAPTSRPGFLPDTWAWVRPELLIAMSPSQGGPVEAVITPSPMDPTRAASLGLTPLQTVGAIGFTQASIAEAQSILLVLGVVLAVVIALLAYTSVGLEVRLRRDEIHTLRSLGAPPGTVAAVYEAKALVLALVGATLGSALGVVLAHAIVSFAPLFGFPNLILLPVPVVPVAVAYALAFGAAAIGGIVPARHAVRSLRGLREARPS